MGLGYAFTLIPRDARVPRAMTGHALSESAARYNVEQMLERDEEFFFGLVRDLSSPVPAAVMCRRSRKEGEFVWQPFPLPRRHAQG